MLEELFAMEQTLQLASSDSIVSDQLPIANLLHQEKSPKLKNPQKMESKILLIVAIIANITWTTNSMPMRRILNLDSSITGLETSTLEPEKIFEDHTTLAANPEMKKIEESLVMEKRSIEKVEKNVNLDDEDKANNDDDDLETAAGTNILRPLFVYRQQVAYRERVRKAGRRAVPNF